ncbi:MAG TPA: hypothetical protein ENG51_14940 [Deltaproteobacteria bacterium]|nr:MAG: hypothetical protein B1H11_04675 [Desulfobacteraceae bacterium 4484_190.1]HDM77742.1 hypothetical protein [Deltaproteobacteria bacterium]
MRSLIEEILTHCEWGGPGFQRKDIIKSLNNRLLQFTEHDADQATELFGFSENFPAGMDDDKLRAWLILAYEQAYDYQVPSRNAVEDALSMIRAREQYGEEFYQWKENQDKACKKRIAKS